MSARAKPPPSRATASRSATSVAQASYGSSSGGWFSTRWVAKRSCADMGASARKTKPRARRGFKAYCLAVRLLHHRDPGSLRALRALHHFEADALAFLQRAEAIGVDRGIVDEHVVAAVLGRDEAEALGVVEPLHGTESHAQPLGRLKVYGVRRQRTPDSAGAHGRSINTI